MRRGRIAAGPGRHGTPAAGEILVEPGLVQRQQRAEPAGVAASAATMAKMIGMAPLPHGLRP
ncbi:MAG: hypothetical protein ACOC20_04435 [Oceanicaulis sp.]